MKIACVTAICGDIDSLRDTHANNGELFIAFVSHPKENKLWKTFHVFKGKNDVLSAKRHKILIHEYVDCDVSLWIDGNVLLRMSPTEIVEKYLKNDTDIMFFPHRARNCLYKEAKFVELIGMEHREIVKAQTEKYINKGYPKNNGLCEGHFIVRRHNKRTKEFNKLWWKEVTTFSRRDQLSLNYCLWKTKVRFAPLPKWPASEIRGLQVHGNGIWLT